jgi:hypothetical protein
MRSFLFLLFAKYNQNDEVEKDEMGRTCSTNRNEKESIYVISGKAGKKESTRKTKT